ncbi:MAG: hypothetical protein DRN81_05570, partial [Thermoproteota archaeon]
GYRGLAIILEGPDFQENNPIPPGAQVSIVVDVTASSNAAEGNYTIMYFHVANETRYFSSDVSYIYVECTTEKSWQHMGSDTYSWWIWVGDADRDGFIEVVSAGSRFNSDTGLSESCIRIYRYVPSTSSWMGEGVRRWATTAGDMYARGVVVGDVDKDGDRDIITCGWYWTGSLYKCQLKSWFKARGNRAPVMEKTLNWKPPGGAQIYRVVYGDLDRDGVYEIVAVGNVTSGVYWQAYYAIFNYTKDAGFTSETWGSWGPATGYSEFYCVALGDADNDGENEFVAAGGTDGQAAIVIYRWDGTSLSMEAQEQFQVSGVATKALSTAIGDIDNDGENEIVVAGEISGLGYFIRVYRWDGASLNLEVEWTNQAIGTAHPWGLDVGDVDDDGDNEIAVALHLQESGVDKVKVRTFRWNGTVVMEEFIYGPFTLSGDTFVTDLYIYDVDQDGKQEIVITGYGETATGIAAYIRFFKP